MSYDTNKVDDAVLALMFLTLHEGFRAWKGFDWDTLDRLYEKGFITDPKSKSRSVVLTDKGLERCEALFRTLFDAQIPERKGQRKRPTLGRDVASQPGPYFTPQPKGEPK